MRLARQAAKGEEMRLNYLLAILMVTMLTGRVVIGQTGPRVQTQKTLEAPKVIKFQGKGGTGRTAVDAPRPVAHRPAPLTAMSLAQIFGSLGFNSPPSTSDYLLLTAQQPYVAGRGDVSLTNAISQTDQNLVYFAGHGFDGVTVRLKPAAVGTTYLIDFTIDVAPEAVSPMVFNVETPDKIANSVGFSNPGIQHVLLTFTSTSTEWQYLNLWTSKMNWYFHSCKVTQLK